MNSFAVADGMGGHKAGEIASNIAIEHIVQSFESMETIGKKEEGIDWLRKIVKEINEKIFEYTSIHPESKGMGTTLVIAIKTSPFSYLNDRLLAFISFISFPP